MIVPHAPVLVPNLTQRLGAEGDRIRAAIRAFDFADVDAVVVLSSHGATSGVYARVTGSLQGFGVSGVAVERKTDEAIAASLADAWHGPLLTQDVDHGVVVPLVLELARDVAVVAATLTELTGPHASDVDGVLDDARRFARALQAVADHRRVCYVASVNTSAALAPQAPLTERQEAVTVEARLLDTLQTDVGAVAGLARDLWSCGGSCASGPLVALSTLFSGRAAAIECYERPFGVGYLVATVPA